MSRSPLAYPLNRSADMDAGGAADLQTDIMRFMAILSLCLVAIFALVQSIPLTPAEPEPAQTAAIDPEPQPVTPRSEPVIVEPKSVQVPPEQKAVVLTRPKWTPKYAPKVPAVATPQPAPEPVIEPLPVAEAPVELPTAPPPVEPEEAGFTLRFASDAALTRAVAAQHVGLYALDAGRARRMTVSESRISFWDASTPNSFHEMEAHTVPLAVIDALGRTGVSTDAVSWGVTLPGKMKTQLDLLMQDHGGGSLIIGAGGEIHWEPS